MKSGIVNLQKIYDFIASHKDYEENLPNTSPLGRSFGKLCVEIVQAIPEEKGFYLWGNYDDRKFWKNIYLGKACFGKTANLRSRILEELKDERNCFWRTQHSETELLLVAAKSRYYNESKRSLLKAGTTHIVYVACPGIKEEDVKRVESDLIESMNPKSNIKRPVPPASLNSDTAKIFHQLREQIHKERDNGFALKLK